MKLAVMLSMFPEPHETFILRELIEMRRQGLDIEIFSLQFPRDPVTSSAAQALAEDNTQYAKLFAWPCLKATVRQFTTKPLVFLRTLWDLLRNSYDRPTELLKSVAIVPITCYFGEQMQARQLTHCHGHWANVPTTSCWLLGRLHGVTWSAAIHGEDIFTPNQFLGYKLGEAEFTVVCTQHFREHLQAKVGHPHPDRVHLNYHGLDPAILAEFPAWVRPKRTGSLLSIGRLVPTKGHDDLLKAFARVRKQHPWLTLKIIGSGPEEASLHALAAELQLEDSVDFLGLLSFREVVEQFKQADLFCLCSKMLPGQPPDGIPNVIAEAMAASLPILSTTIGAIPELVEHGVSGHLVEPGNVDAIAQALANAYDEPEQWAQYSEQAFTKVHGMFDIQANIHELKDFFMALEQPAPGHHQLGPELN